MTQAIVFQASSEELENCAREPIHLTPLIQAYGVLLACDRDTGQIVFASANAAQVFGYTAQQMLGTCITRYVEEDPNEVLQVLASLAQGSPASIKLGLRGCLEHSVDFELVAHRCGQQVVLEAMPYTDVADEIDNCQQLEPVVAAMGALHHHKELPAFLEQCAQEIRLLSGYQRVIIYRFLPDWSGEVLAESTDNGLAPRFLGLRFPASDIPLQARALYRVNLLRVIGDVDAEPVPVHGLQPGQVLDQSHSMLRSPSPMHLGYLRNMGVRATMTISLLRDDELWGMVSCHHHAPRKPPVQLRRITKMLCALIAETVIVRIDAIEQKVASMRVLTLRNAINRLATVLQGPGEFAHVLEQAMQVVMPVLQVQDYGLVLDGQVLHMPRASGPLMDWLGSKAHAMAEGNTFSTSNLLGEPQCPTGTLGRWAGAVVAPIFGHSHSHLVLLREEVLQQVRWAGEPSYKTEVIGSGLRVLGPRASFAEWMQTVQGCSVAWRNDEEGACLEIAKHIADVRTLKLTQMMQSELHMLGSCMARLNDMVVVTDTASIDEPGPRIVYVNDAFVAGTGYTREETLGRSPRFLQGPKTQREALDTLRAAIKAWKPVTVELINYRKNGTHYWAEITMAPIADSTGWFTHWVAIQRDIDERKRAEIDIRKLVFYDALTGLPNRRMLTDRLRLAICSAHRHSRNGALLFVDLDNFKDLNDTAGHHVGDELLRQVAGRLCAEVRGEDTVARLGGDEFVVLLEDLSPEVDIAAAVAQRIAEKLNAVISRAYELLGHSYATTASIGLTLLSSHSCLPTVEELLKQADFAMYQAKSAGRNAWRFYDPATQAALVNRNAMETRLKVAMQKKQLEVHYQPIVDQTETLVGVEALLRWNDADRGWVSPAEFIPIAEHNGLIVPIGLWVLEQACKVLRRWANWPASVAWTVAVNVSARQMRQPEFVASVLRVVEQTGCNPALLKLELTESLLQLDIDTTIAKMMSLRSAGIQFSIDDFGTGYSSLTYLRRLPLNVLKIDRSFVMDIEHDAGDRAICQTVLALGKTLSLQVVAEGVETQEQFEFLRQGDCDHFQGYLFSRPVTLDQLEMRFDPMLTSQHEPE